MKISLSGHKQYCFPSPVLIIGTYGSDDRPNIMNAAWGGIASSKPTLPERVSPGGDAYLSQYQTDQSLHR